MERRHALVTGAAGFIGSHLVGQLVRDGWHVWGIDDFSVGRPADVEEPIATGRCEMVEGDVADAAAVSAVMEAARPSLVYHLAARHFIPACEREPLGTLHVNVIGTQTILEAVLTRGRCRLIFASTGAVYAPSGDAHDERSPVAPDTIYGISKATGEQLLAHAGHRGLDYRIARLFNVFGPGDRTRHVVPDIVDGVVGGVLALGPLDAVRDYVYVDDVVRALLALAEHRGPERLFNVGTGIGRSVQSLVDAVCDAHGGTVRMRADASKARAAGRQTLISDSRLAASRLGWTPRVECDEGLRKVIAARGAATAPVRAW